MSLTPKECADRRASFQGMRLAGKVEYIYEYFKLPIVLGLVALLFVGSTVYRQLTKKEVLLYSALINLSIGDNLESQLNGGFVLASGADPKKAEVYLYSGLYLSDDPSLENHQYQYASKLKLMAAIEANRYQAVTEEVTNGLDVSMFPMFQEAGLSGAVYLGVVRNSPRLPAVIQYIEYLAAMQNMEEPASDGLQ